MGILFMLLDLSLLDVCLILHTLNMKEPFKKQK